MEWQPIERAPKGGGAEMRTDPAWVEPPLVLLAFPDGEQAVCHWDWCYASGGRAFTHGLSAWVEPTSGDLAALHYGEPTHWMPLPEPPGGHRYTITAKGRAMLEGK